MKNYLNQNKNNLLVLSFFACLLFYVVWPVSFSIILIVLWILINLKFSLNFFFLSWIVIGILCSLPILLMFGFEKISTRISEVAVILIVTIIIYRIKEIKNSYEKNRNSN